MSTAWQWGWWLAVSGVWTAFPLAAQTAGPSVRAVADPPAISVGDRLTVTVTVSHHRDARVSWPEPETLGVFEVLTAGEPTSVPTTGEMLETTVALVLTVFEVGDAEIPPITVTVTGDTGVDTVRTSPLPITVASLEPDASGDIRDIKPPLTIGRDWWRVALWVLALAAVMALAWWGYRRYRRRPTSLEPTVPVSPRRSPDEEALAALDALQRSPLLERGDLKTYFTEVAEILRVYVEARYGILALEMTTDDLLPALGAQGLESSIVQRFETFFRQCDLVKFAKHRPARERCDEMIPMARDLVERTKPVSQDEAA